MWGDHMIKSSTSVISASIVSGLFFHEPVRSKLKIGFIIWTTLIKN